MGTNTATNPKGDAEVSERKAREGVTEFARELGVPYTRIYNMMIELDLDDVSSPKNRVKIVCAIQDKVIKFDKLSKFFGAPTTLRQLTGIAARNR